MKRPEADERTSTDMLEQLKKEVCDANLALVRHGLVILTWGNVSAIDKESGLVVIKPSGVPYDNMKPEHMVVVDLSGKVVEGNCRPSSDTDTHVELYKAFGPGAVVHTHSKWATIWAQAGRGLPALGTTHADNFYGGVPVTRRLSKTEIAGSYELETGRVIVETFRTRNVDPAMVQAVLVAGHGPFAWGADSTHAVENAVVLDYAAEMAFYTLSLNGRAEMDQALLDKHYLRKHGKNAYYGQK
jgi:L-ribulose-5-phosphate 4-epimerase